jgi:hypothetical protein
MLHPDDITNDPIQTIWKCCARNGWTFVPDFTGNEPWIDIRCASAIVRPGVDLKTARNTILAGLPRRHGLVRLSDVMKLAEANANQPDAA